jgi:hypothetical protein
MSRMFSSESLIDSVIFVYIKYLTTLLFVIPCKNIKSITQRNYFHGYKNLNYYNVGILAIFFGNRLIVLMNTSATVYLFEINESSFKAVFKNLIRGFYVLCINCIFCL